MTTRGAAEKPLPTASALIAQYEALRMAMLGEILPPEARSGLTLFLRRGMWGWARSPAVGAGIQQVPLPAPRSHPVEPSERSAVIHVFAALAMTINKGRMP